MQVMSLDAPEVSSLRLKQFRTEAIQHIQRGSEKEWDRELSSLVIFTDAMTN
jgi:hypothetical protein